MLIKLALFAAGSAALLAVAAETADAAPPEKKHPVVVIETSMGTIKVELYEDKAPITVKNFLAYTDDKFYDGTVFHRVMSGFMIQGGGLEKGFKEKKTKDSIKSEADNGVKNAKYTIAMARTPLGTDTATAQFFINLKDNVSLDHVDKTLDGFGYTAFGKVIDGADVVEKIKGVKVARTRVSEATPLEDVVIKSVRRAPEKDKAKEPEKK